MHEFQQIFADAWADPSNTRIELPAIDVNAALEKHYDLGRPLTYTGTHLWDMEQNKAARPDLYLGAPLVLPETLDVWENGDTATRTIQMRRWTKDAYGRAIERYHLDHDRRVVTFLGTAETTKPDGTTYTAATDQPLFHVEHGVSGPEDRPENTWRLVALGEFPGLREFFDAYRPHLPHYIEYHIREVLGVTLSSRA